MSSKSVQQECLTRVFRSIERERVFCQSVPQECRARVSGKSVSQECPVKVSHKSAPQECQARVSHTIVREECQARVFCKSGFQCDRASPVRFSLFCRNPSSTWAFKKCIRVRGFYQVLLGTWNEYRHEEQSWVATAPPNSFPLPLFPDCTDYGETTLNCKAHVELMISGFSWCWGFYWQLWSGAAQRPSTEESKERCFLCSSENTAWRVSLSFSL